MGMSGCGKSLVVKVVFYYWGILFFCLDMNLVFFGFYGILEVVFDCVLCMVEGFVLVVLWIDEIENLFGMDGDEYQGNVCVFLSFFIWM